MTLFSKLAFIAACVLTFSCSMLSAQAPAASRGSGKQKEKPTLFFEVVYWGSWMDRPLKFKSEGKLKAISLQAGNVSGYIYTGPSPIVFYREEEMDEKTKELKPIPILSIPFEVNHKRAAILITPGKDKKLTAQMIPMTPEGFPPDKIYFSNASGKPLRCKMADYAWEMTENEKKTLSIPVDNPKVYVTAEVEWQGSWQMTFCESFPPQKGERRLYYFYTPAGSTGVLAKEAVIPPDTNRFDEKGRPIESASADPNQKPVDPRGGTQTYTPNP